MAFFPIIRVLKPWDIRFLGKRHHPIKRVRASVSTPSAESGLACLGLFRIHALNSTPLCTLCSVTVSAHQKGKTKRLGVVPIRRRTGWPIIYDYTMPAYWYGKAATQGNIVAESNLGNAYFFGQGVPNNYNMAVYWWRLFAAQGNVYAENNINALKTLGRKSELIRRILRSFAKNLLKNMGR